MDDVEDQATLGQIAVYCGRLSCRKPIVQDIGPGRRKEFCSDTCRRGADREFKRAKAHVELFEEHLRRTQHEVAAYGRKAEDGVLTPEQWQRLESEALVAFTRAATIVELGRVPERAFEELEVLVNALRPFLENEFMRSPRSA